MSTPGDYHEYTGGIPEDACGGYHEYTGGVQYTGRIPSVHWGCSVHRRDTMSTLGHFGTNEKGLLPNFQDFCSRTFCSYAVVYVDLLNIRQLVKISLSGSQNPDPNTFFVSSKSLVSKCPVGMLQGE